MQAIPQYKSLAIVVPELKQKSIHRDFVEL